MSSHPKVRIPRLERRENPPHKWGEGSRHRVPRACLNCRTRKVKCNGVQPQCKTCEENGTPCVYASSRKDRLKIATEHNQELMRLLQDLQQRVSDHDRTRIEHALAAMSEDIAEASTAVKSSDIPTTAAPEERMDEDRGEANVSAEVGSNEDLDLIDEDLLRDEHSRATGFVGKNSEIQWLRRLRHETDRVDKEAPNKYDGPYGPPGHNPEAAEQRLDAMRQRQKKDSTPMVDTNSLRFYLDDERVELDYLVQAWELPPFETARRLVNCYLSTVHDTFPIIAKKSFTARFYHYYSPRNPETPKQLPQKWQGMLNIILAIGAVYSHLLDKEWRADDRDHLVYHARAWSLTLNDPWWFAHPDLPQLQITALLGFYYLSIGHINRSWMLSGMALRAGYALGLHLRNEDRTASAVKKELLRRIWWSLYTLESSLSALTGRPSIALQTHCSVPFPLPLSTDDIKEDVILSQFGDQSKVSVVLPDTLPSETSSVSSGYGGMLDLTGPANEPANAGSYLKATVKISMIIHNILTSLYSPSVSSKSWQDIQNAIVRLNEDLEVWAASLPADYRMSRGGADPHQQHRTALQIHYFSAKIMMTRPCLCRLDRRIDNQTKGSHEFNRKTAEQCVRAAKDMTKLLPNDPDADRFAIYHIGPWWSVVHIIMQALTILLLELSYDARQFPRDRHVMLPPLKKLIRWLRAMRPNNTMARRAHHIAFSLLRKMVLHIDVDISDLIREEELELAAQSPPPDDTHYTTRPSFPVGLEAQSAQQEGIQGRQHPQTSDYQMQQQSMDVDPNPYDLSHDQLAFLGSGEFDLDSSTAEFMNALPSRNAFTNMFVTMYDEQNPYEYFGAGGGYAGYSAYGGQGSSSASQGQQGQGQSQWPEEELS